MIHTVGSFVLCSKLALCKDSLFSSSDYHFSQAPERIVLTKRDLGGSLVEQLHKSPNIMKRGTPFRNDGANGDTEAKRRASSVDEATALKEDGIESIIGIPAPKETSLVAVVQERAGLTHEELADKKSMESFNNDTTSSVAGAKATTRRERREAAQASLEQQIRALDPLNAKRWPLSNRPALPLYLSADNYYFSEYQVLVRSKIEFFEVRLCGY